MRAKTARTKRIGSRNQLRQVSLAVTWWLVGSSFLLAQENDEFFEKRIRPILVEHCYSCHSAEAKTLQGELRLDLRAGWQQGGESGVPAIVPGKPDESPLIRAVRHDADASAMPPKQPKLKDSQIADLTDWVRRGASDPRVGTLTRDKNAQWETEFRRRLDWWSLRPVAKAAVPSLSSGPNVSSGPGLSSAWPWEPVDQFILQQLQRQRLEPAPDADSLTLLRRWSFVLTGLPPTAAEVERFPAEFDQDPARARMSAVDRLLASPHFGERLARHWMDVVRYTDTYGYEWDNPAKGSWEYRDYLIRSFNRDVSFQQLIREQIAGDLLAVPRVDDATGSLESLIGPMFYHMGEHRHGDNEVINGVREEMIDNKVDAFSKAFLAMTIACARCHDHKLDAVSQRDYYALAGMFMMPRWTSRAIDAPERHAASIAELQQLRAAIQRRLTQRWQQQAAELVTGDSLRTWALKRNRAELVKANIGEMEWLLNQLLPTSTTATWRKSTLLNARAQNATAPAQATVLESLADGSILAKGEVPAVDSYTITFRTEPGAVDRIRLEALTDDSLGQRGPGRTAHGNFVLTYIQASVRPLSATASGVPEKPTTAEPHVLKLVQARADYEQPNYPVADALHPDEHKGWGVGLGGNKDRTAWFVLEKPLELPQGGEWTVTLEQRYGSQHTLGRFRISVGMETPLDTAAQNGLVNDEQAVAAWQHMKAAWQTTNAQRRELNAKFKPIVDFHDEKLPPGFSVDGAGMRTGFVVGGEPLVALQGEMAVQQLLPRGFHTHALSSKLPGALRLPRQEDLPGPFVSLALAGDEWSGYLRISDNAFQTENVTFLSQRQPTWMTLNDIPLTNGIQRVAYEVTTSDLNPNFPPRTGVARAGGKTLPPQDEGFDKRSWFSVMGIVSHDQAGQPQDDLQRLATLFSEPAPATAREAWQHLGKWVASQVSNYQAGNATTDSVPIMNWLLSHELLANRLTDDAELHRLVQRYRTVEAALPFPRSCNGMDERGVAPLNYALNVRGDINRRGDQVPRGLPQFVESLAVRREATSSSGRLELADFLADEAHGLAARVFVNRVWQWLFGEGLVRTSNDFGHLGEQPTHPELLDYLANEFMADGWSTKRLVRRLVLSRTFHQSSQMTAAAANSDPGNRWLHHYPTRRLEAESIRDTLLAVAGQIDHTLYGRPLNPQRQVEDASKRLFSGPLDGRGRRSIYLEVSIMDRSKFLQSFNSPDPKLPTGRRDETNAPAQALVMLNDPFVLSMAEQWANRLVADPQTSVEDRLQAMFTAALGRRADREELARWRQLLLSFSSSEQVLGDRLAWKHVAHTMFNLQEFTHYR
ncbi:MAG: PSD1 and planctomycete cytochrome C domain-containing protein [Planctomycetota bacterium]